MNQPVTIRSASIADFEELYAIGKSTPELRVSATEELMDADEFRWSITSRQGVFLVAEEKGKLVGFIYADAKDMKRPFKHRYACLVYLVVFPESRGQGIASKLYAECEKRLHQLGITNVYSWANAEGDGGIINFLKKNEFAEGHKYLWMDKPIS